jgi:hypothetical protein
MKIGVISDTHGWLDPQVEALFAGVEHILHAGDMGSARVLDELRGIAPVTAVLGNVDFAEMGLRDTATVELGGLKFLLHHIVQPRQPGEYLQARLAEWPPDVVVFGHSHIAFDGVVGGVRFFNPGYAGMPRFNQPRSVAVFELTDGRLHAQFLPL